MGGWSGTGGTKLRHEGWRRRACRDERRLSSSPQEAQHEAPLGSSGRHGAGVDEGRASSAGGRWRRLDERLGKELRKNISHQEEKKRN
jgi:hypothetical protein